LVSWSFKDLSKCLGRFNWCCCSWSIRREIHQI